MYHIELTEDEHDTLHAMADKGYDCGMFQALGVVVHERDGLARYEINEHAIWPVHEAYNEALEGGNDPWGPFVAATLRPKLDELMQEVV